MKKTILILLLFAGIVIGGSFQVGRVIESELPTILQRVGELGQMQISITDYQRNIFRSSVKSTISLASISGSHEQIFLTHTIWHGPLPFGKSSNGQWHFKPMSAIVETTVDRSIPPTGLIGELFAQCPELFDSFELTRFDFAGNGISTYKIPGFNRSFGEGEKALALDWQGLQGTATIDKSMKNIKGEVVVPTLRLSAETSRIESSNIRSSYKIYEDFGGLLLGNVTLDVTSINLFNGRAKTTLSDFQFRNAAKMEDETVSYSIAIGIETLQKNNETYGPAGFELDFIGLDAATILKVQKRLQTIQAEVKKLTEEEISNRVFSIYAEALPELMQKTPEVKLNYLNMTGPGGEFWSKGNLLFENPSGEKIRGVDSFLATIKANIDSQISQELLLTLLSGSIRGQLGEAREAGQLGDITDDQFTEMVTGAASSQMKKLEFDGAIIPEGKNYRAQFAYQNRTATLNGRPLQSTFDQKPK